MTPAAPSLFAQEEAAPRRRQPTQGEHVCQVCKGAACYGLASSWFCMDHVPQGFLPKDRAR